MFNTIIYFIVVLLIFNLSPSVKAQEDSLIFFWPALLITGSAYALYCAQRFRGLLMRIRDLEGGELNEGTLASSYQRLMARLSILAIILFAFDTYVLNLKPWIHEIPGSEALTVVQGMVALGLFLSYLCTLWYFAYPVYRALFNVGIDRGSFVRSNLRLNVPLLFPWLILSLFYDLIALIPWQGLEEFLHRTEGQVVFFGTFLGLLMTFMPGIINAFWRCEAFEPSMKLREMEGFLRERGFRYRGLLKWPLFEGRMMTAGIMGLVPRYRYILLTESLFQALSVDELESVLAHEMGHAKYRHLLFYFVFFLGFLVLSMGLSDLLIYFFLTHPIFGDLFPKADAQAPNLFYPLLALPMLLSLIIYFRYVMGFFMRNFERQADLYSAAVMGHPSATIRSLEKIAFYSGRIRDLPSWHHFGIGERVACLWQTLRDPGLLKRHNRFLAISFLIYLVSVGVLGYGLNYGPLRQRMVYSYLGDAIHQQIMKEPGNLALYQNLAMVYHHLERFDEAMGVYEKILELDPNHALALNNMAWLLLTGPDKRKRDPARGLDLAKRAVVIERSPAYLDTLAEAYYLNGLFAEAIETIRDALALARENRSYYEGQQKKFLTAKRSV